MGRDMSTLEEEANPCHNHQEESHFVTSFTNLAELRSQDILTDITLVSDDKCEIRAHKLVLMACSEYFRIMFKSCYAEADLDSLAMPGKLRFEFSSLDAVSFELTV